LLVAKKKKQLHLLRPHLLQLPLLSKLRLPLHPQQLQLPTPPKTVLLLHLSSKQARFSTLLENKKATFGWLFCLVVVHSGCLDAHPRAPQRLIGHANVIGLATQHL
jgi:hypothetical protein